MAIYTFSFGTAIPPCFLLIVAHLFSYYNPLPHRKNNANQPFAGSHCFYISYFAAN